MAILTRECDPVLTRSSLPGNLNDTQARYVEAAVNGVLIASIYLPNGNPQPGPKFDYKLAWFQRLIDHGAELMKAGVPVILAGDYNVVPAAQDIYPTRSLDKNALIQPQSRQAYARLLSQGWTDALRKLQPEGPLWTFWDYERNRWPLAPASRSNPTALRAVSFQQISPFPCMYREDDQTGAGQGKSGQNSDDAESRAA